MNNLLTDDSGTYGWGRVLDYIGVGWREQDEQMTLCMDCPASGKARQDVHGD